MEPRRVPIVLRLGAGVALVAALPVLAAFLPPELLPPGYLWLVALGDFAVSSPNLYGLAALLAFVAVIVAARALQALWFNQVRARLSGTHAKAERYDFPFKQVDLLAEVRRVLSSKRLKESYFIGIEPAKRLFGRKKRHYLTEEQLTMHVDCIGQTGSGKTASCLLPLIFQFALRGKGLVFFDRKGSAENLNAVRNMAAVAGRTSDLRVFSLPFPDDSHSYNPLWLAPRTDTSKGGDPLAVAERAFSIFKQDMQEAYYKNLGESLFRSLIRVLHGMADNGASLPFAFTDVLECLQNREGLLYCLGHTEDRLSAKNIHAQMQNLGEKFGPSLMGLQNMTQKYADIGLINVPEPDVMLEEALEKNLIVYFQLPANYYGTISEDIGKIALQDLVQASSRRQIHRASTNQLPFGVFIDEFADFAFTGMISALNKLRDANIQFFLAHQSIGDLERVSKEFATGVSDNTRTKLTLFQNNPALCEQIAKSIGTYQTFKTTSRQSVGALAVRLDMGEQSLREVEEFRLHPNRIKSLAPRGQAYLVEPARHVALNLGCLPKAFFTKPPTEPLVPPRRGGRGLFLRDRLAAAVPGVVA
ncbi:MAG: type IV secretion system DNA-binding domain-containing protein [Deltaproteobacteria bacterium]|nr:type IV secretion system DNA-binding domain-containing protein [Deltaproteobacteria bacterium]